MSDVTIETIDPRKAILERVQADFTYKKDMTQVQLDYFARVKRRFQYFNEAMGKLIRNAPDQSKEKVEASMDCNLPTIPVQPIFSDEWRSFKHSVRTAERWCNTAIANDWNHEHPPDMNEEYPFITYEGPSGGDTWIHEICDQISKECYELTCDLCQWLPLGRSLSLVITHMQEVRGWLLDAINMHCDPNAVKPEKTEDAKDENIQGR